MALEIRSERAPNVVSVGAVYYTCFSLWINETIEKSVSSDAQRLIEPNLGLDVSGLSNAKGSIEPQSIAQKKEQKIISSF